MKLPKKAENPFKMGYYPEVDSSPQLDPDTASYYLNVIGILRWMIALESKYIRTKMSLLPSHVSLPRVGY